MNRQRSFTSKKSLKPELQGLFVCNLDVQQIGIDLQGTVGIVCQNLLGQNLAQLDTFLVEAVQIPCKALEHDLVLEVGKQSAQSLGSQLLADDDGGGAAAFELLVQVGVILAAGKCHDLSSHVGTQLLLGGGTLDDHIAAHLAVTETNELQGDDVSALMEQLIEGVLAIGAGLAEDDRASDVIHGLAETVDGLAVGLHIQLLQVSGEADRKSTRLNSSHVRTSRMPSSA